VSLHFFLDISFRPHYGPGVGSDSNRNEYKKYFLGVMAAGAYGSHLCHLPVPIVLKSGSLSLLEPSRPVKACNGIALPLPYKTVLLLFLLAFREISRLFLFC
jgi:hypothetical protein